MGNCTYTKCDFYSPKLRMCDYKEIMGCPLPCENGKNCDFKPIEIKKPRQRKKKEISQEERDLRVKLRYKDMLSLEKISKIVGLSSPTLSKWYSQHFRELEKNHVVKRSLPFKKTAIEAEKEKQQNILVSKRLKILKESNKETYTMEELAKFFFVGKRTIQRKIALGEISYTVIYRVNMISKDEVERLITERVF